MIPDYGESDLDAELVFDRILGKRDLNTLQELLVKLAPDWSAKLRIGQSQNDQWSIPIDERDSLATSVLASAAERGPTYHQLVKIYGRPECERMVGSAELRGSGPELTVIISVDEIVISSLGDAKQLGNNIDLQIRSSRVERRPAAAWLEQAFKVLCEKLTPAWGYACHPEEYWAKVMGVSPSIAAIGRDFVRYLPGVFWLNYFGPRYQEKIGADRLRSAPAERVSTIGDGILISLAQDPSEWRRSAYANTERQVRDHLGREQFFEKQQPARVISMSRLQRLRNRLLPSRGNLPSA